MQFTVHTAKTQLSKLIEAALNGEEVVIARGKIPAVRLVPVPQNSFAIGSMKGKLGKTPDFLDPMNEADLADWEG